MGQGNRLAFCLQDTYFIFSAFSLQLRYAFLREDIQSQPMLAIVSTVSIHLDNRHSIRAQI